MPRDGTGHGDNAIEFDPAHQHNIVHGAGDESSSKVARADKTATPPPGEKGFAIEGLNASGGGSYGYAGTQNHQGKANKDAFVDRQK